MSNYNVTMAVVAPKGHESGMPEYTFQVEADDQESAMEKAFDLAFAEHPDFGAFYVAGIDQ